MEILSLKKASKKAMKLWIGEHLLLIFSVLHVFRNEITYCSSIFDSRLKNWKFLVNKPILKFWFMFIFQQTWWIKNRGRNTTIRYLNSSEKNSFGKNYKNGSLTVTFFTIACLPQWVKIFFFYVWFKSIKFRKINIKNRGT